jgi:hypothetical protein
MVRSAAILGLVAALCVTPALADPAADTLKRLKLLGRWANDCADPARRGVVYEIDRDSRAVFVNIVGPHRILSATSMTGEKSFSPSNSSNPPRKSASTSSR